MAQSDLTIIADSCRERFFDQKRYPRLADWQIFLGGLSQLTDRYVIKRQTSGYHMVVMTLEGEGVLKSSQQTGETLLSPGSVLLVPSESSIHYELSEANYWHMAWFMLEPGRLWQRFPSQLELLEQFDWQQVLANTLHSLGLENQSQDDDSLALQRLYCEQIYLLIHRAINQVTSNTTEMNQRLKTLIHEIEVSPQKNWNVEQLCCFAHCSRAQLNRLFQSHLGCSPSRKVTQIKMQHASLLLRSTQLPIKQVGHLIGFDNAYNFSNRFKQVVGCSPSDYRGQHSPMAQADAVLQEA